MRLTGQARYRALGRPGRGGSIIGRLAMVARGLDCVRRTADAKAGPVEGRGRVIQDGVRLPRLDFLACLEFALPQPRSARLFSCR
jgi:hypothetical protein